MTGSLTYFLKKYRYVFFTGLSLALLYGISVLIVREKLEDLTATVQLHITEQKTLLTTIAETTARNGADTVTESIVKDCNVQERTEFDTLLSQLNSGLSNADLVKLERLFGRCGSFYAERKSVMVARLTREIEVYTAYVDQLAKISDNKTVESYNVATWKTLAEEERKQSELFSNLVIQQDKIITTLLSGKASNSDEIKAILQEAQETQQMLIVTNKQAADIRATLIPL